MTPEFWAFIGLVVLAVIGYGFNRALKKQVAPPSVEGMWARIQNLEEAYVASSARERTALEQATNAKNETVELKHFIVDWISRLLEWDSSGRKGRMPLPSDDELSRLDIKHPQPKE